jgi:hypothetical protein
MTRIYEGQNETKPRKKRNVQRNSLFERLNVLSEGLTFLYRAECSLRRAEFSL